MISLSCPIKAQYSHPPLISLPFHFRYDVTDRQNLYYRKSNLSLYTCETFLRGGGLFMLRLLLCMLLCLLSDEVNQREPLQITFNRVPSCDKKGHVYV